MNCLCNELQFAIHLIGFSDLQFIRWVLKSDAAGGVAATIATTMKMLVKINAVVEEAARVPAAAASVAA